MITHDHLKLVMKGEKGFLKMSDVRFTNIPKFDECSVLKHYDLMMQREELKQYFPNKYSKGRNCERDYFWNVVSSFYPEEVDSMVKHANVLRF